MMKALLFLCAVAGVSCAPAATPIPPAPPSPSPTTTTTTTTAPQLSAPIDPAAVAAATGAAEPEKSADGVVKASFQRKDVDVAIEGWKMPPFMGLTSWAAFSPGKKGVAEAMVMGDLVLFEDEVNPAMSALLENGVEVTALHNHFFFDSPRVYFMHIGGEGAVAGLGKGVRAALDKTVEIRKKTPKPPTSFGGPALPAASTLDASKLEAVLGTKGQAKDGMFKIVVGRKTSAACGCEVGKAMGVSTWAAFAGSDDNAVVDGDFAVAEGELQAVLRALRAGGINIVAIHHHMSGETPRILFLHYWGRGKAADLGATVRKALDLTASERSAGGPLPLDLVADVDLPGGATRFDYQAVDAVRRRLVVAHMNDGAVLFNDVETGKVLKELKGIPTARGVVSADDVGLVFVTSMPDQVVVIDAATLAVVKRVKTGNGPDGIAWDPGRKLVGVSDQKDGALSILADSGSGARTRVALGVETGNVVYDAQRRWFFVTVVSSAPPDKLVAVDPTTAKVASSIDLPGCEGAHGLRIHPDGKSAFVACEKNDTLVRVDLDGGLAIATAPTGKDPDVLAIDPALGLLYVAAESGDLTVFDTRQPGLALVGHDRPGDDSHSVAVDPSTHHVFFPLARGPKGTPVLRIMRPSARL